MPSFKKSLIVEQFQGNYLKIASVKEKRVIEIAQKITALV